VAWLWSAPSKMPASRAHAYRLQYRNGRQDDADVGQAGENRDDVVRRCRAARSVSDPILR
jgi:hypothetical protein